MKHVIEARDYGFRVVYDQAGDAFGSETDQVLPPDAHRRRPARQAGGASVNSGEPASGPHAEFPGHQPGSTAVRFTLVSRRL